MASETDYSSFDKDIQALVSGTIDNDGPHISGYIQPLYENREAINDANGNNQVDAGESIDISGFEIGRARFSVKGNHGDYGYKLQVDFAQSPATFFWTPTPDIPINSLSARFGQFKPGISAQRPAELQATVLHQPHLRRHDLW